MFSTRPNNANSLPLMIGGFILLALAWLPSPTLAKAVSGSDLERHHYQQAMEALHSKNWVRYGQHKQRLTDYPLYPYLVYAELTARPERLTASKVEGFAKRYADTPLPPRLARTWYSHLIDAKRWDTLTAVFDPKLGTTTQQCHYLRALYRAGNRQQAFSGVPKLWTVSHSQPQDCDPLFRVWMEAGKLTSERALKRFWLAMNRGNLRLASYLEKQIHTPAQRRQASLALEIHRNPQKLADAKLVDADNPAFARLLRLGVRRLTRQDPEAAAQLWSQLKQRHQLDAQLVQNLDNYLGIRLAKSAPKVDVTALSQLDNSYQSSKLTEWRIRLKLREADWNAVIDLIDKLPSALQSHDRWRYWKARAQEARGQRVASQELYAALASERSFYGFLAADRLSLPLSFPAQPLPSDTKTLKQLQNHQGMRRARELAWHGQLIEARREWHRATKNLDAAQHQVAGQLALQWGWHAQAIRSAIAARAWDILELRFPLIYQDTISEEAEARNIDPNWIFAVARQESAFTPDAQSSAGAMGLMQLMPRTASQTAKKLKTKYQGKASLKRPEVNIQLGSAYLAELYQRFNGNRIYASAAYNAGPYRVSQWLEERGEHPGDIWIELIPFDETRQYVQNVLSYSAIYAHLQGQQRPLLNPGELVLAAGEHPQQAPVEDGIPKT